MQIGEFLWWLYELRIRLIVNDFSFDLCFKSKGFGVE